MLARPSRNLLLAALAGLGPLAAPAPAQEQEPAAPAGALPEPRPLPEAPIAPTLETVPVLRNDPLRSLNLVDTSPLPRDLIARRQSLGPDIEPESLPEDLRSFWVLDFAFKPLRLDTVELPGEGRKQILYLYYRIINRTGKPRLFVPQFTLITDSRRRFEDRVMPRAVGDIARREESKAVRNIRAREDLTIPLHDSVTIEGMVPPTGDKEGVDDAVYGVALWVVNDAIANADAFSIYVRGLSNGYQPAPGPAGSAATTQQYKTLRIDFVKPGDDRNLSEREIRLKEPPYEWIYW